MTAISTSDGSTAAASQKAAANKAANQKTDGEFADLLKGGDDPKDMLAEITSGGFKGYWAWRVKEMKARIAQQVMGAMGVTREGLAQMSEDDRAEVERLIMREVARQVREMTSGQAAKGGKLEDRGPDGQIDDSADPSRPAPTATGGAAVVSRGALGDSTLQSMLMEQEAG